MSGYINKPTAPQQIIQLPPTIDSECLVLGTIIYEPNLLNMVHDTLTQDSFSNIDYAKAYKACVALKEKGSPIDIITLTKEMARDGMPELEAGRLIDNLREHANISSFNYHINILNSASVLKELAVTAQSLSVNAASGNEAPASLIDSYINVLDGLRSRMTTSADMIKQPTRKEMLDSLKKKNKGIETPYWVVNEAGTNRSPIVLPSGALTFFCAPTSHGKSTILRNLAWHIVQNVSGDVLYFTFEESADALVGQFTNLALNENLNIYKKLSEGGEYKINNRQAIEAYFNRELGNGSYLGDPCGRNALTLEIEKIIKADQKFSGYYCSDMKSRNGNKLYIVNKDISARQLASLVESHYNRINRQGRRISAIMIDYVQLIAIDEDAKRDAVCYALKKACDRLRAFSIKTDLPVICAAQLKNDVESPLAMRAELIADSSDIGKAAHTIVCMWNSIVPAHNDLYYGINANGRCVEAKGKHLTDIGFYAGGVVKYGALGFSEQDVRKHKIYMKVVKRRGDERNVEGVFDFNGNTGVITPNEARIYTKESEEYEPF